jgi:DNA ligase-1
MKKAFLTRRAALVSVFLGHWPLSWMDAVAQTLPAPAPSPTPPGLAPMLGKNWQPGLNPADFLVSEKLDGVRALWDGQTLRFRSGRTIAAPDWFLAGLPATPLDGELWLGRGTFDRLSAIVRRSSPLEADWRALNYMLFDLPGSGGPFAERAQRAAALVATGSSAWLQVVAQERVADANGLQRLLQTLVGQGAEGLMLHRADALWTPGRSDALRKLKPLPDDEARVVAHVPGKGRLEGKLGALQVELPSGQRFALGSGLSDADRLAPPPIGSLVTYRYRGLTPSGLPRFATFVRQRADE